tara:strand:- start:52 stop:639 length:588 start_codon:yes stop_codon:yes gene_type:complete
MAPSDEAELVHMVATASAHSSSPIAFRYPRGEGKGKSLPSKGKILKIGKGRLIEKGYSKKKKGDLAFISIGTRLDDCIKTSEKLSKLGYSLSVADARFAKPIDEDLILELARNHNYVLLVEEGSSGGFTSRVIEFLSNQNKINNNFSVFSLNMPDFFIEHKSQDAQILEAELDQENIYKKAIKILSKNKLISATL